jgi:peptide/nickel transport system permease protein
MTSTVPDIALPPVRRIRLRRRGTPLLIWCAVGYLGILVVLAILGPGPLHLHPATQNLVEVARKPGHGHLLGTDDLGRDVLARLVAGARLALIGPLVVATVSLVVSAVVGITAGYLGGLVDQAVSRVVDFMFALPGLLVAIVVVSIFKGGYWLAIAVLSTFFVQGDIRIVRSAALEQRPLPYVESTRVLGFSSARIMFRHILPNILPILIADMALNFSASIIGLAGLAFLGLGGGIGRPEWGRMLSEGQPLLFSNPAAALAPGAAIVVVAVSVNLIGDWMYERYHGRRGAK